MSEQHRDATEMTLGNASRGTVSVLLPGTSDDGPAWHHFVGADNRDVVFSTALPPDLGAVKDADKKLIVNPNAMMLMAFQDADDNS